MLLTTRFFDVAKFKTCIRNDMDKTPADPKAPGGEAMGAQLHNIKTC